MKKTIAKIMAAAMVLSAVPAVALPTLTAEAKDSTTVSSIASLDSGDYVTDGGTGIYVSTDSAKVSTDGLAVRSNDMYVIASEASTTDDDFFDLVSLSVSSSTGEVQVKLNTKDKNYAKYLVNAVKNRTNVVRLTISDTAGNRTFASLSVNDYIDVYLGGYYDADEKAITTGIEAAEGDLADGNVYAKLTGFTDNEPEVEILKGDTKNASLDDNDDLRGETLDLTTITVGGLTYNVVRLGAQSLKKAHMKKFVAENTKRIGKGALRQCKQLKHADIEDGQKVRKINSKAFYNDKNLKTIIIDGRKLNTIGKNAFHGVKKNCTIKIKATKKKFESDKKMILKNGGNKNLKFVRK